MTNQNGRFGIHGGQYIPETLMNAVIELEEAYNYYKNDPEFNRELTELLNEYAGRPSRLYFAQKMTKDLGGAKIYLKREDLNHTGAHKINNVLGQALLAKKMGKTRLIAVNVWNVSPEGKTDEQVAREGLKAMENWMNELGLVMNISELGANEEMLESIADVTFPMSGGYKELNRDEILRIFKESLQRKFTKKSHQEMSV